MARRGWKTHLLFSGSEAVKPAAPGVVVHQLKDLPLPKTCLAPNGTPGCGSGVYLSNLIRYGVEILHQKHHFDAIVFPTWQAAGFRCVQAKRAGIAFLDAPLVVHLDGVNQWQREEERRRCSPDDIFLGYCERYTFENADGYASSSAHLLEYVRGLGWNVQANMRPVPFTAASLEELVYAIPQKRPSSCDKVGVHPAVTVAVSHHNLGRFLPETLASLAAQTCSDLEVLVLDDGSTCVAALRVWDEQKSLYPQFRFIRQSNIGLGAARIARSTKRKASFSSP